MLKYLLGGNNFLADTLSWMPHYKRTREEIVSFIISLQQLAAQCFEKRQPLAVLQWPNEGLTCHLKEALQKDEWFKAHHNEMTMREDLAQKGDKLYVPATLRTHVL